MYNQKYELQTSQPLMFGATNGYLDFGHTCDVYRTTVQRIFAIQLTGQSISTTENQANFVSMMAKSIYYKGLFNDTDEADVWAFSWLSFGTYFRRRDTDNQPHLNSDTASCKQYQDIVYQNNSRLYKTMKHFYISSRRLMTIITNNINRNSKENQVLTVKEFKILFQQQYGVSLDQTQFAVKIENIKEQGLVVHIMMHMETYDNPGAVITRAEIEQRLEVYTDADHKGNADNYFQKINAHKYNFLNRQYENISFVNTAAA